MLGHPKNDPVYSQQRLDGIMGRRRLSFNPYSVSDRRLVAYPESPDYLDCNRGLIDYEPRVRLAIELIRSYPDTPIPED